MVGVVFNAYLSDWNQPAGLIYPKNLYLHERRYILVLNNRGML